MHHHHIYMRWETSILWNVVFIQNTRWCTKPRNSSHPQSNTSLPHSFKTEKKVGLLHSTTVFDACLIINTASVHEWLTPLYCLSYNNTISVICWCRKYYFSSVIRKIISLLSWGLSYFPKTATKCLLFISDIHHN